MWSTFLSWYQITEQNKLYNNAPMILFFIRFCCFHLSQPICYFVALFNFYEELEEIQKIVAILVGIRECAYFVIV